MNTLQDYNWNETGPNLKLADEQNTLAEDLKRKMEEAYEKRDNYIVGIDAVIRASKTCCYRYMLKTRESWATMDLK